VLDPAHQPGARPGDRLERGDAATGARLRMDDGEAVPLRTASPPKRRYDIGAGAAFGAATSDLTARKSATEATATHSSQSSIVKTMTERIAATPATKPNQLTQRGRIA